MLSRLYKTIKQGDTMKFATKFGWMLCVSSLLVACGGGEGDDDEGGDITTVPVVEGSHQVLAFNDLGMHCADLDYSTFVILPPFNVVHSQVIERGAEPRILTGAQVDVTYRAQRDASDSLNSTSQNLGGSIHKSNFWDTIPNSGGTTYVEALFGADLPGDMGLLGLAMPGIDDPYNANDPQPFHYDPDNGWFAADGIPILPIDDAGQTKPYPLMRVEAKDPATGELLASVDTVLPVASEADCQNCHAIGEVGTQADGIDFVFPDIDTDPNSVLQAAKINILLLHDAKHGTTLMDQRPVLCASCHYSAALDLAGSGPQGDQLGKPTMSGVMHGHHGELTDNGVPLFPSDGTLEETCYQCHPGKVTKCLRGAMGGGGIVCQDCHGDMLAVGNENREPWLDEPLCGSCHTGDVLNNLAGTAGTVTNTSDVDGNSDGIRLRQAFLTGDDAATPIVPDNSRFSEVAGTLYRNSFGHGDVACEGCHGSTHAIWPNALEAANDNLAAIQIQGHSGTIIECSACHTVDLGNTLDGPHGMHPVGRTRFADGGHEGLAERNPDACRACHGRNGEGSVLSRTAADRDFRGMERGGLVAKGTPVTCTMCHENEL
jgi:hypothetical protein